MSSKSKSGLSETSINKASSPATPNTKGSSPATPRVSKLSRGVAKSDADSPAALPNPRVSVDRSPRSVTSKPAVIDRRSPKLSTPPPDKQPIKVTKGSSELQSQLTAAQEELKKTKEKLSAVEKEKTQAIAELNESNEKLREAVAAQKRAEADSEIEKFRAVETEQAGIEAAQKKEENFLNELENVRNQHALDVASLLSSTQELQRVKQELQMTCDAKNQALAHADDATKIAEIHAEKVEILSAELIKLKNSINSRAEIEENEKKRVLSETKLEVENLRERILERENAIEELNVELEASKMAESYARSLVEEWRIRVEEFELKAEKAEKSERSASESLESIMKNLEKSNDLLHDREMEIETLKEKMGLLEISNGRVKSEIEEYERRLDLSKEENSKIANKFDFLNSEIETLKEEKIQALNNEKLAAESVQTLLEEKNKLINELENSRDEEEKSKKAMESLASALHEVSSELRESKEKLLGFQSENKNFETQIKDLNLVLKTTNEKYESVLENSKHEIDVLTNSIEFSKSEWEQKENFLNDCLKKSEEENVFMEKEINRLHYVLKQAEEDKQEGERMKNALVEAQSEGERMKNALVEAQSEAVFLREIIGETKAESMRLKESLMDKETEFQSVVHENDELKTKEASSLKKIEELSKSLEEAMAEKAKNEENGDLTGSEKEYDMLPQVVEFSEQNGGVREENNSQEAKKNRDHNDDDNESFEIERKIEISSEEKKEKEEDDSVEVEFKMWESCKIGEKDFSPEGEKEKESFEEEVESKSEEVSHENGEISPLKEEGQHQKKKKKPLLGKFGSLLKKKGGSNPK